MANWFITGCSAGLGRALARRALQVGHSVALTARDPRQVDDLVDFYPGRAIGLPLDVRDHDRAVKAIEEASRVLGPIDVLVNNAGHGYRAAIEEGEIDPVRDLFETNFLGPIWLAKAVLPQMRQRGSGTIVNVTSDAATEAYERWGAYGASKAALEQLGRVWAAELAGTGVRVITVDPGEMDTRMHADAIPDANRAELADPARVAAEIVALLQTDPGPAPGARVAIRSGPQAAAAVSP